jgi:hypothetical protein
VPLVMNMDSAEHRKLLEEEFEKLVDEEGAMGTNLTPGQMKEFVRQHFEDFVNRRNAAVIHKNMTPDFYDHDGPGGKPADLAGEEQMMVGMY